MSDPLDFFRKILPPENIFEIKTDNMEFRFEDLTKEQLIAELNVANEKLKYYRHMENAGRCYDQLSPHELQTRLQIAETRLSVFEQEREVREKKREFERRLVEATDFLKANGYQVRPMMAAERFPVDKGIFEIDMNEPHLQAPWTIQGGPPSEIHLESTKTRVIRAGVELKWTDNDMELFGLYCCQRPIDKTVPQWFQEFLIKIIKKS